MMMLRAESGDMMLRGGPAEDENDETDEGGAKSRYSAFRKASTCPFCREVGVNCGKVAAKCPNRPCNKCDRRHRLNRCKRVHCKHCFKEDHLSSKCPVKLREWSRASVERRREQRAREKHAASQQLTQQQLKQQQPPPPPPPQQQQQQQQQQ